MRRAYPPFGKSETNEERWMNFVTQERNIDLLDFNNLPQRFITGRRRTDRLTPTSSTDVSIAAGDQPGDVIIKSDYFYILVDIGGNVYNWKRIGLTSF